MSADPSSGDPKFQAALALHRFGFGPRPGGIAAIASDPRGALLAELKPGAGRLDDPELLNGGEAARAAFDFRQERRLARLEKRAQGQGEQAARRTRMKSLPKWLSLVRRRSPSNPCQPQPGRTATALSGRGSGALRRGAGIRRRAGRAAGLVLVEPFLRLGRQGPVRPLRGAYRARGDPPACARQIRRHAAGGREPSGDADLSRQCALDRAGFGRRLSGRTRASTKTSRAKFSNCIRSACAAGYTQDDVTSFAKVITGWTVMPAEAAIRSAAANSCSIRACMSRARRPSSARAYPDARRRAGPRRAAPIWRGIRRPASTSRPSWRGISSPTSRRRRWSSVLSKRFRRHRRRSEGGGEGAGRRRAGSLGRAAHQTQAAGRMDCRRLARDRHRAVRRAAASCNAQNLLGEPLWRPPAPKGFSDDSAAWLDGLAQRLDIANQLARRIGGTDRSATQWSKPRSARSRRRKRGRRSRAPKAGRRRWRCC